jgi:SAM-dependent methyltransferase
MSTWYDSWFESPWYMKVYRHRTESEAREAVALVEHVARVPHGARVLDLACGYGRHALALAEAGYRVVGLDNSTRLIDRAKEIFQHPDVDYVVGDMRGPFPEPAYDAIVNFFTSFGYFDTDAENAAVFTAVAHALKPGGRFVMDFLNANVVRQNLVPESMSIVDGATVIQERTIEEPFVRKEIIISNPCSYELTFNEQVWMYSAEDLQRMAVTSGLVVDHVIGDYNASPFNPETSPRCILIAHRPLA